VSPINILALLISTQKKKASCSSKTLVSNPKMTL
jgi:hypothetical protein